MIPGAHVRFKAHGETGLVHTLVTRDGNDCSIQDPRGRVLRNVPVEMLVLAPAQDKAWREVDELEA